MEHWKLKLENDDLRSAYDAYLYRQDSLITYYLSTVAVMQNAVFDSEILNEKVRASNFFSDSATSIKRISDVVELVESEKYEQLSRSMCVLGLVTTFTDFFDELRIMLDIPTPEIKKSIELTTYDHMVVNIRPASLKIANYINNVRSLDARIADVRPLRWINCIINIRHMFIHDSGLFSESYAKEMFGSWSSEFKVNEPIKFNDEQVDSILWYLNDHVRDFANKLDQSF